MCTNLTRPAVVSAVEGTRRVHVCWRVKEACAPVDVHDQRPPGATGKMQPTFRGSLTIEVDQRLHVVAACRSILLGLDEPGLTTVGRTSCRELRELGNR
jgi:hypothetical protein